MNGEPSESSHDPGAPADTTDGAAPRQESGVGAPRTHATERAGLVVRPGIFLTAVILSAFGAGLAIYWLLRSMHI